MRFITFVGLTLIVKAIDREVFFEHSLLLGVISIISMLMDLYEFGSKYNKK